MKNNSGFSLIELLVVITILAIFSAGAVAGLGYLTLANTGKCASKIDSGFTVLKSRNMSKAEQTYMHLYNQNDEYYLVYNTEDGDTFTPDGSGECIGNNKLKISMDDNPIEDGEHVSFSVRKKDGSFVNTLTPTSKITVSGQSAKEITIVTSTGKHFVEAK